MIRLRVGEEGVSVRVSRVKEGFEVRVGEAAFRFEIEPIFPGAYLLRSGDSVETFYCVRSNGVVHLSFRGTSYQVREEAEGGAGRGDRSAAGGLETPMPGKVIKVHVSPGHAVVKGQEVLVVEAMKMENVIRAPRDGTVTAVKVTVGQMVSPGSVLVELA